MKWASAWALALGVGLGLSGCARLSETGVLLLRTTAPALAIVNGQMLQGEVQLLPDRTGSVELRASSNASSSPESAPISNCMGRLRFTGTTAGEIDLRCNDGSVAALLFSLHSDATGYAYGQTATAPVSLTFGMRPSVASAYLTVPPQKPLAERADGSSSELQ
ncbi:MAG: hypothetical protein A3F78_06650 [Burkholderiales bacterium RIFCSPLOWO2_12_FULL_61_40]|nr:MAG: hypothetical protein A3F78_06650 [Burkholderiales bacterium RIFCSPLOWO2_12_FULL_61_40]